MAITMKTGLFKILLMSLRNFASARAKTVPQLLAWQGAANTPGVDKADLDWLAGMAEADSHDLDVFPAPPEEQKTVEPGRNIYEADQLTDEQIQTVLNCVAREAALFKREAGMQGEMGDRGARAMEDAVAAYRAGLRRVLPIGMGWEKHLREADPDWPAYVRLRDKFEKTSGR